MQRIHFIHVIASLVGILTSRWGVADETRRSPNVIFILADDLGWADTALYGHTKFHETPNLQRLAGRGITLTRAYSASPLCSPTRSAILTGLSPARIGITTPSCHLPEVVLEATVGRTAAPDQKTVQPRTVTRLKTEYRTLAESLKEAGYATGHFGKWHLGTEPYSPLQQGFDVDLPHHPGPGPAGSYVAPWKFADFDPDPDTPNQHIEDRMAEEAGRWMEANQDRPFFLNYWMFSVHAPFDAKKELIEKHRGRVNPDDQQRSPTYAAMVESMDDAVGTLLDTLDRLKLTDNTIIIFTSDNGGNMYSEVDGVVPTSNRPLRGGKASMFEGGVRVPGVVIWPGVVAPGSRSDAIVQSEDYFPTLLEGLKLSPAPGQQFDGISVLPALKGKSMTRDAVVKYFPHNPGVPDWLPPSASITETDWKLIRIFHGGDNGDHRNLLFHLKEDLSESTNVADRHPEIVQRLDNQLTTFLVKTEAVLPVQNPAFDPARYRPELEGVQQPRKKTAPKSSPGRTSANNENDPGLKGWKPRSCEASVAAGHLRISDLKGGSFLGFAAGKHRGLGTVTFRIKAQPGSGHVDWLPNGPQGDAKLVLYKTGESTDWQNVTVKISADGPFGVLRIYLPHQEDPNVPVEIDWIEIISADGAVRTRTDF
jgi:arylsulfatase A-like enzyme